MVIYLPEFNPKETPLQRKMAKLTNDELLALQYCRQYRGWRKKFSETRDEYLARRPEHVSKQQWAALFDVPHGCETRNNYFRIVRHLLSEKRI